jgi:hypothetical protein
VLAAVARERVLERRLQLGALAAALLVAVGPWPRAPEPAALWPRSLSEHQFAALEQAGIDRDLARWLELPPPLPLAPPLEGL